MDILKGSRAEYVSKGDHISLTKYQIICYLETPTWSNVLLLREGKAIAFILWCLIIDNVNITLQNLY